MFSRRGFKQPSILGYRLETEAANLRRQAEGMPHGIRREELLRKARQAETASRDDMDEELRNLRNLASQLTDQTTLEGIEALIVDIEAEKAALPSRQ